MNKLLLDFVSVPRHVTFVSTNIARARTFACIISSATPIGRKDDRLSNLSQCLAEWKVHVLRGRQAIRSAWEFSELFLCVKRVGDTKMRREFQQCFSSTFYITYNKANITQFDAYLPYGELLVDEHSSSEDMPYKFNGKELDQETGLYYYGARYMQPVTSIWYGVDPLFEKYPDVSGYCYTMGNPINLIDEDGLFPKKLLKLHKTFFWQKDYYTFTQPMAHVLSLVSDVNEQDIKNTRIYKRGISKPYPWYFGKDTYGGITLPEGNDAAITYTNNLFDDSKFGQDYYAWLNISSHEVGHINHIKASNKIADKNMSCF